MPVFTPHAVCGSLGPVLPHVSTVAQHCGGPGAGVIVTQARWLSAGPGARLHYLGAFYQQARGSGC